MKFVFDLDEVLVVGDIIEAVSKKLLQEEKCDRIYTGKDASTLTMTGIPEYVRELVIKAFSDPHYAIHLKSFIPEAYYFLSTLKRQGHQLYVLTARPVHLKSETISSLSLQFAPEQFDDIIFANSKNTIDYTDSRPNKKKKLADLKPNFYFDDCIDYCNDAAELDIESYLISNAHTGWNHDRTHLDPRVKVIKHVGKFDYRRLIYGV